VIFWAIPSHAKAMRSFDRITRRHEKSFKKNARTKALKNNFVDTFFGIC
jgi:hypothetical protein